LLERHPELASEVLVLCFSHCHFTVLLLPLFHHCLNLFSWYSWHFLSFLFILQHLHTIISVFDSMPQIKCCIINLSDQIFDILRTLLHLSFKDGLNFLFAASLALCATLPLLGHSQFIFISISFLWHSNFAIYLFE